MQEKGAIQLDFKIFHQPRTTKQWTILELSLTSVIVRIYICLTFKTFEVSSMLQVTVRNLERKCYMYSQNIYILFSLGVIPLDRHLVNQASFGNQFQTSIQEKSKRYHKQKKKKKFPQNAQNDKVELVEY